MQDDGRKLPTTAMVISSRSSSTASLQDHVDSTWQLVNLDKASTAGPGQATTTEQTPTKRHRRDHTEGPKRLSMFRSRSRTNTISTFAMGRRLSPSVSLDSSNIDCESEDKHPQSGWSDSDHSDSQSRSWVARGSKMLKKKNSKLTLGSSKAAEWVGEHGQAGEDQPHRGYNKHGRMWSTGNGSPTRPHISQPYDFQHLTHTQARHFSAIRSASQDKLATEFLAINASQPPRKELRGIRVADIRSNPTESFRTAYAEPVTPPLASPARSRTSRPNSVLSAGNPGTIPRSRSIDNFSQPSPKTYRFPRSPTSPPPRTSSCNATRAVPDFFSDQHHATAEERELLSMCEPLRDSPTNKQPSAPSTTAVQCNQPFDEAHLPHAITTPDDVAFTLQPPMRRRSTLALADVPEEDEVHSTKRASIDSSRPMTTDSTLRHAKSFPSKLRTKHSRKGSSSSCNSTGRPDSVAIDGSLARDMISLADTEDFIDVPVQCLKSRISTGNKGIDARWEDDIDYCYQLKAEADCEFEWDRISMNDTRAVDAMHNKQTCTDTSRESADSLCRGYEMLRSHNAVRDTPDVLTGSDDRHLPRLETSLPDLEFSAASSAKSSMASLRGPVTPLQQIPSPGKGKIFLQPSRSTDNLNLDSSFFVAQDYEVQLPNEDSFPKECGRDHTSMSSQKSHIGRGNSRTNSSTRSSRPRLSRHASSESILLSDARSSVQTHRKTASGSSLKDLACSKNYRQYMEITTKQIADRLASLSVANFHKNAWEKVTTSNHPSRQVQNPTAQGATVQVSSNLSGSVSKTQGDAQAFAVLPSTKSEDQAGSVASFACKLRSNSVASSASGSSSARTSRISYSLFPSIPPTRT